MNKLMLLAALASGAPVQADSPVAAGPSWPATAASSPLVGHEVPAGSSAAVAGFVVDKSADDLAPMLRMHGAHRVVAGDPFPSRAPSGAPLVPENPS